MKWQEKQIRRNKTTGYPREFALFDCETVQEPISDKETAHHLKLGWLAHVVLPYSKNGGKTIWYKFTGVKEFWDIIEELTKDKRPIYVASHNLNFDLAVLDGVNQLEDRGWTLKFFYVKGYTVILKFKKGKRVINLFSTTNWFHSPLKELGKIVDLPKLEVDFDATSDEYLSTYCKRDVEILVAIVKQYVEFCRTHECGKFRLTAASQA